jgi:hypothetical protein
VLQAHSTTVLSAGAVVVASGTAITGTYVSSTYAWSLTNFGTITAPDLFSSSRGTGVYLHGVGDQITNVAGGVIDGRYAVSFARSGASVVNYGTIGPITFAHAYPYPNSVTGVSLTNGGAVTNEAGGTIAGYFAIYAEHASATVTNAGAILGFRATESIDLRTGGEVTNQAGGTIAGVRSEGAEYGVYITGGAATVINAGTIAGSFAAVRLASGYDDLLVAEPGATFNGLVNGSNPVGASHISVLELAAGASPGTLGSTASGAAAPLGWQFINFASITVDTDASWTLIGDNTIESGVTLTESSGALLATTGTLSNYGDIVLNQGTMRVGSLFAPGLATSPLGALTLGAGSTLEVQGSLAGGQLITFAGSGAYLHLDTPDSASGAVTNFDVGETIDLQGIAADSVTLSGGNLLFSGGSFPLALASANTIQALPSGDGAAVSVLCFCAGTLIQTPGGEVAVQSLAVGDAVLTRRGEARWIEKFVIGDPVHARFAGTTPIKWIGHRRVDCRRHPKPQKVWPVRVRAGAFDEGLPHRDLWLSPDHAVFVDDVLIPIKHLINGTSIEQVPMDEVTYYHVELEHHDVLLAEGLPTESYLDTGDRFNLENGGGPIALHPEFSARRCDTALIWEALGCAPLVVTGPAVEAVRQLVNSCASAIRSAKAHNA